MIIGGYQPCSLCDYPGRVASVIFTQGCNFRCPFCHNKSLLHMKPARQAIDVDEILDRLKRRRNKIDSLVVSGGEPTVHNDLPRFLEKVRALGLSIKLDTNGSNPAILASLIQAELLDYVAMDIKAPFHKYAKIAGVDPPLESIARSIQLLGERTLKHEFRTTVVPSLLSEEDILAIKRIVPVGSEYRLQAYRVAKHKY